MVKQETYTFNSADGHSVIHCRRWLPEAAPVAVLQLVHGMVEYIERYDEFATYLAEQGYLVVGHDHIGHGHSVASVEELGVMTGDHPQEYMVADIYTHYTMVRAEQPDIPYFILGHSMGSYMLRKFLADKSEQIGSITGAIIMGTGMEKQATCNAGLAIINATIALRGKNYRSAFIRDNTYSKPYKRYDCYGKDYTNSWLSCNTASVEKYYHDPLCTYMFTANAYKALVETTRYVCSVNTMARMRHDMPLLVVSGQDDPVGNLGQGTTMAADAMREAGVTDVTLKLYPGDRHEILNELDRATVMADIYAWMESKRQA